MTSVRTTPPAAPPAHSGARKAEARSRRRRRREAASTGARARTTPRAVLPEVPTPDDIVEVASDATRSLADEADVIARCYHDLCLSLAQPDFVDREDLNWCGFAQWSSKAIGAGLRLDRRSPLWTQVRRALSLPRVLGAPMRWSGRLLLGGTHGRALSFANRSIFLEIGTLYTNLLDGLPDDVVWQSASFNDHPLSGRADEAMLRLGAHLLDEATRDRERRAELVFGASIALSAYEQARAQPALEFAFYRPIRWLLRVSWRTPYHLVTGRPLRRFEIYTECHERQHPFVRRMEDRWARLFTRVLWLETPVGPVWMSRDLSTPPAPDIPAGIAAPSDPRVCDLVRRFRPPGGPRPDRGVSDWLDYPERMRFIVGYFASYQRVPQMFDPPFPSVPPSQTRRARMAATVGKVPSALRRIVPVPRIADPSIHELASPQLAPERVTLTSTAGAETPCRSRQVAHDLSRVGR